MVSPLATGRTRAAPASRAGQTAPLRKVRALVRDVLAELNRSLSKLYASEGRPA
jgi:hypothetical protein